MKTIRWTSLFFVSLLIIAGCGADTGSSGNTSDTAESSGSAIADNTKEAPVNELKIEDEVEGTGPAAESGDTVTVHYTLWLYDESAPDNRGKMIQTSHDFGRPFPFTIDRSSVIQAWHDGVKGVKEGGTRILTLPPELGYGAAGSPPDIPPNATLIFKIEVLEIQKSDG